MEIHRSKIIIILLMFIISGCKNDIETLNPKSIVEFDYNLNSKELKFAKPFGLVFMIEDCGACYEQNQILNTIEGFDIFIVANGLSSENDAMKFIRDKNITKPIIYKSDAVKFLSNAVGGVDSVPAIYFYDKTGKMDKKFLGLTPKSILLNEIKLLN